MVASARQGERRSDLIMSRARELRNFSALVRSAGRLDHEIAGRSDAELRKLAAALRRTAAAEDADIWASHGCAVVRAAITRVMGVPVTDAHLTAGLAAAGGQIAEPVSGMDK